MIPTKAQNPKGLHQRYIVTKADGEPVDQQAVYLVLRLDEHGRDNSHTAASRAAARAYADFVKADEAEHLDRMADDLVGVVDKIERRAGLPHTGGGTRDRLVLCGQAAVEEFGLNQDSDSPHDVRTRIRELLGR